MRAKLFSPCLIGFIIFTVAISAAEAASFNDASSGNWNAGATWGNAGSTEGVDYPGLGDTVTINSHTVTLTADASCGDITISTGGTLTASSYTITVSGSWDSSGGTFNYGTSTIKMTGSGKTLNIKRIGWGTIYYNLIIDTNASVTNVINPHTIGNDLTINDGATYTTTGHYISHLASGDIIFGGSGTGTFNIQSGSYWKYMDSSSSAIPTNGTFSGSGIFYYVFNAGAYDRNVTARTYGCNLGITGDGTAQLVGDALNLGSKNLLLYDNAGNYASGAILNANNVPVTCGTLDISPLNYGASGVTSKFIAGSATHTIANIAIAAPFYSGDTNELDASSGGNATFNISGNITISGSGSLKGVLTAGASTFNIGGNWANSGTFTCGTSTINFNKSSGTQSLSSGGTGTGKQFYHLTHSGAGTLTCSGYDLTITGALVNSAGTFNAENIIETVTGLATVSGGTYSSGTGANFNGGLTVSGGAYTGGGAGDTIDINGNLSITSGSFASSVGANSVSGNLSISSGATFTKGGTLTFDGTSSATYTDSNATLQNIGAVAITKTSGTASNNKLTLASGLSCDSLTISVNNTLDAGNYALTCAGNWANSGTFTAGTSTVTFNKSSGTQTLNSGGTGTGKSFYNLQHSGAGTLSIITNDTQVDGALDNTAGAIVETSSQINHPATSCLLTNSSGSEVSEYIIRTDSIYARLVDEDENLNASSADTATVTVSGGTNGDSESFTVTETGNATEIFLNSGLTTAIYDGAKTNNDGTLELSDGEAITVSYTDGEDNTDTKSDIATCRNPTANFLVSASSPQTTGTDFTLTITARNADGSTASGYSGTVNLSSTYVSPNSGTKSLAVTSTSSFTNGVATVTQRYDDAGVISITATDSGSSSMTGISSNITFVPDSFTLSSSQTTFSVNEPFTLNITAKNAAGTTCANYKGASTLSINYITPSTSRSGALSISTLTASSWSGGGYALENLTYNRFGIITITCKDPDNTAKTGTSAQLTFLPKDLYVEPATPSGGRDFYYQGEEIYVTVTARDYNGATINNYAGTVGFSGESLSLPGNYSFSSLDSGAHIFSDISATGKDTTAITATDTAYSAVAGTSSSFKVRKGKIVVSDTSGPVGTLPVNIRLVDSDGNDITNDSATTFTVSLKESRSDNSASCPATAKAVAFKNGKAQIELTDTQAEVVTVTPKSEDYLEPAPGKVAFGGVGSFNFTSGFHILFWRILRSDEEP